MTKKGAECTIIHCFLEAQTLKKKGKEMELSGFIAILVIVEILLFFIWLMKKVLYLEPGSIFDAVMEFRYDLIEQYLEAGGDINLTNRYGMTFLMIACDKGASERKDFRYTIWNDGPSDDVLELMDYLIKKGCDINKKDVDGNTAVFFAAGEKERLEMLLDKGADINYLNNKGETALMQAAKINSLWKTETLLKAGANPFIKNRNGKTAFDLATEKENTYIAEIIEECIDRGCNAHNQ